jgi:hypothetical protein
MVTNILDSVVATADVLQLQKTQLQKQACA